MGIGGISIWQLLIVLLIVVLLFGTKKLRNMGGDLGNAIKNFRQSLRESSEDKDDSPSAKAQAADDNKTTSTAGGEAPKGPAQMEEKPGRIIDAEATHVASPAAQQAPHGSHDHRSI